MIPADPTTAVLAYAALYTGHHIGDYLLQSDHQALTKGRCGHAGRMACTRHVLVLTVAQALALVLVLGATGTAVSPWAVPAGLAINAVTHWWADRRATLRGLVLATEPMTHKTTYYDNGGAERMDQAWHVAWMIPAALAIAAPAPLALAVAAASAVVLAAAGAASRRALAAEAPA
ncbi:DUF3307 domain-containing protein [Nocardiopsis sp. CNT-189]|uniref:hypothetical protein n=1 Tax=Nocardiopsis oceanisediminis TaxID=2816862 RepID=UPI003B2F2904